MPHHGTRRAYGRVSGVLTLSLHGVRQRDVLAPTLFNLFFDAIIATALARHPHFSVRILHNFGDDLVGSRKTRGTLKLNPGPGQCWWHGYYHWFNGRFGGGRFSDEWIMFVLVWVSPLIQKLSSWWFTNLLFPMAHSKWIPNEEPVEMV